MIFKNIRTRFIKYKSTVLLILCFVAGINATAQDVSAGERQALVDLYNATNGPNWTNNANWNTAALVTDWHGVTVVDGKVTALDLRQNNLVGTVPSTIGSLVNLQDLFLNINTLSGAIPTALGSLTNLQKLYLGNNQFTGTIPNEISQLVNLQDLYINNIPALSGTIPAWLGQLSNLRSLSLVSTALTGTIPAELGQLSNLRYLYLSSPLTGTIPPELGQLGNLNTLLINNTQISGSIPPELGQLSSLISIHFNDNQLSGSIPVELGNLSNMQSINLTNNVLSGSIPNALASIPVLRVAYFTGNMLSGRVPVEFSQSASMESLFIRSNEFVFADFESEHVHYQTNLNNYDYLFQAKVDEVETLSVAEGGTITLTSTELTSPNNSYQWYKNGVAITGATNKDYVITNATATDAGVYRLEATNSIVTGLTLVRNDITLSVNADTCGVSATEKQALLDLYNATGGANWTNTLANNQPWNTNIPVCDWFGVTVVDGKVTELNLGANNLVGPLPLSIGELINLELLYLQQNSLNSNIPITLGQLVNVRRILMHQNQLTGSIPNELGSLSNLEEITLYFNQLIGGLPISLGQLSKLLQLNLHHNQLSGTIPVQLGQLTNLQGLHLDNNNFSGTIPVELDQLINLITLGLSENQLTGGIPPTFSGMTKLATVYLDQNQLSGPIPSAFGTFTNLRILFFESNEFVFSDWESEHVSYQSNLSLFRYSPQAKVDQIETQSVNEGGTITLTTTTLTSPNNSYQWFKDGTAIPGATAKDYVITNATSADAGVYYFEATNSIVTGLTLTRNNITLTVDTTTDPCAVSQIEREALIAIFNATNGPDWTNNTNWNTSVPVCQWYGVTVTNNHVTRLNLYDNALVGTIPPEAGNLTFVEYFYLHKNQLSGTIPPELGNLSNVIQLWIQDNQLTGTIPISFGSLLTMVSFQAGKNQLTGPLPSGLGNLTQLEELSLGYNQITGSIPPELGNMSSLKFMNLFSNQLSGSIPPELGNISTLTSLYLWGNQLTGSIPSELGNLTNLTTLYLYNNQLSGAIPPTLGNLINMITLRLESNQLTGSIPPELGNLTRLGALYVSSNQLTGSIPIPIGNLPNLTTLLVNNNQLSGVIPAALSNPSGLNYFAFYSNNFVFSNFESEHVAYTNNVNTYLYSPQAKVDQIETLSINEGGTITLTTTALTSPNNSYQWFKNGTVIPGATGKDYVIANATSADAGVYYFQATNSIVTGLTLTRNDITLTVSPGQNDCSENILRAELALQNLINHLIDQVKQGTSIPNPYNPAEMQAFAPYVSGATPAIYDFLFVEPQDVGELPALTFSFDGDTCTQRIELEWDNCNFSTFEVAALRNINGVVFSETGDTYQLVYQATSCERTVGSNEYLLPYIEVLSCSKICDTDTCGVSSSDKQILLDFYNATNGPNWTNTQANNQPWDPAVPVCDWYGVTVVNGNITELQLHTNNLSGNIPINFWDLRSLTHINFNQNNLSGALPVEIGNLTNLDFLAVGSNNFYGNLPGTFGQLSNLVSLNIQRNSFSGALPVSVSQHPNLDRFIMDNNRFIFSDFETEFVNLNTNLSLFIYSPQAPVDNFERTSLQEGQSITLTSNQLISTNNNYQWYKDNITIPGATSKDLVISNASLADSGVYTFRATNTVVINLTLHRNPIVLDVSDGSTPTGNECDVLQDNPADGTFNNCVLRPGESTSIDCAGWTGPIIQQIAENQQSLLNHGQSYPVVMLPPISRSNITESPEGGAFAVSKVYLAPDVIDGIAIGYNEFKTTLNNLKIGTTYTITFYQTNGTDFTKMYGYGDYGGWRVRFGDQVKLSQGSLVQEFPQWVEVSLTFTATDTSHELGFTPYAKYTGQPSNELGQHPSKDMVIDGIKVLEMGSNCGNPDFVQRFCTSDGIPTVADLTPIITDAPPLWYTTETGGTALDANTPLTEGVYWQDIEGNNLIERIPVTVYIDQDRPIGEEIQYFDFTTSPTLLDVAVTPTQMGNIIWFTSASGGLQISAKTALVEGTTYYAQEEGGSCRLPVTVLALNDNCEVHFNFNFKFPAFDGLQPSDRINVADGVITFVNNTIADSLFVTTYDDASIGARHYTLQTDLTNTYPDAYVNSSNEIQGGFFRIQNDFYFDTFRKIADKITGETRIDKTINVSFFIFSHDRFSDFPSVKASYDALLESKTDKIYFIVLEDGYFTRTSDNVNFSPGSFIKGAKGGIPIEYAETNSILNSDYIKFSRNEIASSNFKFQLAEFLQNAYNEIKGTGCVDGDCEDPLEVIANGSFERAIKVVTDGRNESLGSNGWTVGSGTPDTFLPPLTNTSDPYLLYTFTNSPNGGICAGALRVGSTTESFYADVPGLTSGKTYVVEFFQSNATNLMLPEFLNESFGYWKVGFGTQVTGSDQMESMPETPVWERAKLEFIASASTQRLSFEVASTANDPNLAYPVYMLIDGIRIYEKPLKDEFACSDIDIQFFCSLGSDVTIADLVSPLSGATLWFSQQTGGVQYASGDLLEDLNTNFVWADNGSGDPRIAVEIVLDNGAPEGDEYQEFDLTSNPTVGNLQAEGSSISWYNSATSTVPLALTTPLVSDQVYFAAEGNNECRLAVEVFVGVLPPQGEGFQEFCSSGNPTVADLEMDLINSNYTLSWYSEATGGTLYSTDEPLVDGLTYYAELSFGTDTSEERFPVLVSVVDVDFLANIYEQDVVVPEFTTIAQLSEFYQLSEEIQWYNAPSDGTAYGDTYEVIDGETYYARIGEGICDALEVLAVTVSIQEVEEIELITCIKFVPTPGNRYMISGWVREDALETVSSETRNFEEVSGAFVDLLEYLKDKVLANEELPDVYVPKLDPNAPNVDAIVPYIKNATSKNVTIYNFEREMESSEGVLRTVGFSFSLDPDNQYRFTYMTPKVRYKVMVLGVTLYTITRDYHYPMLNNPTIQIDFTDASVCGSNFCITSDFSIEGDDPALWADLDNELSDGSSLSGIEPSVEFFTYQANPEYQVMDYLNASIELMYKDIDGEVMPLDEEFLVFRPKGAIIDGWQRISADFTIPVDAANITITLKNVGENINAYFDDVRVHPFDANTKSFAYDPVTQRLLAELDENNYTTFYEYDSEGGLVRVKKETERGVYTIQETRSGNTKK